MKRKKGFFSISAVAKMFSVHQQTIRLYEKEGLILPKRSDGNTRLFSEEDVNRLEEIIYLTHQLGINLAGVEMILKLKKQIKKLQKDMNKVFENTQKELEQESELSKLAMASSARKLLQIKQNTAKKQHTPPPSSEESKESQILNLDNWEIDYEE
jgi:MerR family transcriptional regulator, heat shock protein HspR